MGSLIQLLGGTALSSIKDILGMIFGSKMNRETNEHDEAMGTMSEFSAEFQYAKDSFLDSLVNFLNRLPRPTIVFMLIYYLTRAVADPNYFQVINKALETVPPMMWDITMGVVGFYFIAREWQKSRNTKLAMSQNEFNIHIAQLKKLQMLDKKVTEVIQPKVNELQ